MILVYEYKIILKGFMIRNPCYTIDLDAPEMVWFGFMVLNATFNKISAISWQPVFLVEETGGPRENHRSAASH